VAIYEYQCKQHGHFERVLRLGTAPPTLPCPACGQDSTRVFSTAILRCGTRPAWIAAMDRAEKSRHEPEVVASPPPDLARRGRRVAKMTPQLARLPRP
jgi:putative FmdB family regulatory protein